MLNQTEETVIRGLGPAQHALQLFHLLPLRNLETDSQVSTSLKKKKKEGKKKRSNRSVRLVALLSLTRTHAAQCTA